MAVFRALAQLGLCATVWAHVLPDGAHPESCGPDDTAALLQTSAHSQPGSEADARLNGLQRLLDGVDIQQTMAQAAAAAESPSKTAMKLMQENAENKELHAALDAAVETNSAVTLPQAAPWQQSEMAQIQEEMRVAMRQLAPDPAEFVLMLQQKSLQEKVSVQADAVEKLKTDAVLAGQMWRRSVAVHEQIIGFLPRLAELLNDRHLWEQLKSEGQAMAAPNASALQMASSERLAESFPRLISSGAAGLRRWGALESLRSLNSGGPLDSVCPDRKMTPKWVPEPGIEPYGNLGSYHGVSWDPVSKVGLSGGLSFGIKSQPFKSTVQQEGLRVLQYNKFSVSVAVSHQWPSRDNYLAVVGFDFISPCGSNDPTFPFAIMFVVLKYRRNDVKPVLSSGGIRTSYSSLTWIGGGTQVTLAQPQIPMLAMTGYLLEITTRIWHKGVAAGGSLMGWKFGLANNLALVRQGRILKAILELEVPIIPASKVGGFPNVGIIFLMKA